VTAANPGADEPSPKLLAALAYDQLRTRILDGELAPGRALSVPALASDLGMSRSPVREAVQRLIHDGLATHVAHRGAVVARVDAGELNHLYVVKEPLEGLAARLATERLTLDGERRLRALLVEHEELLARGGPESAHVRLDLELHRTVHLIADNPALLGVLDQFAGRTNLAFPTLWGEPEMARLALDEHRAIVDAMVAGDPDEADRAARRHVARIRVRWARRTGVGLPGTDIPAVS
jgi:DNA-binding GntR family transcriptional regulator